MQSHDYVPGVSGWKLDRGNFELNSARLTVGGLPNDPQLITVTAGEWSDSDMPSNGLERYAFIGAELMKIPPEYRDSAEFSTEDISCYHDGSDIRTSLTYERCETAEEVAARQKKAALGGTCTSFKDGVMTLTVDGVVRLRLGNLEKSEAPPPFVVVDGQLYLSETFIKPSVLRSKISGNWRVKMELRDGKYVAAGIGLGINNSPYVMPDIIVKASHMEILPDGLVKVSQAPKST